MHMGEAFSIVRHIPKAAGILNARRRPRDVQMREHKRQHVYNKKSRRGLLRWSRFKKKSG